MNGARAALVVALAAVSGCRDARSAYVPRDGTLRTLPIYLYPASDGMRPARAVVFFFGNDVGFWEAHQELAERLARDGYSVAGFDVKRWLGGLPDGPEAVRDSAFAAGVAPIIARARHELDGDALPLIVGGHSIGAEFAVWTAAHALPAGTVGVLMLSPGLRSHLRVTVADQLNAGEPTERGSFAVPDAVRGVPAAVRIALVRGDNDRYRYADSAIVAAGGGRLRRFRVALAGHSMKRIGWAVPVVEDALGYLVAR